MRAQDYIERHADTIRGETGVQRDPVRLVSVNDGSVIASAAAPEEKYWWHRLERGVFTREGRFVSDLSDRRGNRAIYWPKKDLGHYDVRHIQDRNETVIFGGSLYAHFGHFLVESLSRVYFFLAHEEFDGIPILFYECSDEPRTFFQLPHVQAMLQVIGLPQDRIRLVGRSTRYSNLISMPRTLHDERWFAPALGRWIGGAAARGTVLPPAAAPARHAARRAFISRSRIISGTSVATNGAVMDEIMRAEGFDILHPETLPIPEQIALYRRYDLIAGAPSSFFHLKLFSGTQTRCLFLVPRMADGISANFLNIDSGMDYQDDFRSFAVRSTGPIPRFQRSYVIDPDDFRITIREAA